MHRDICAVAICEGGLARAVGRMETSPEQLELFGRSLAATDRVVLEATGNAWAIAQVFGPHVSEVVLAHPKRVRAIAEAKVKTDKVDARVLAELLAADDIPRVWIGDELTRMVARRRGLVERRTQINNEIQALPIDERLTVDGCLRQLHFLGQELEAIDSHDRRAGRRRRGRATADDHPACRCDHGDHAGCGDRRRAPLPDVAAPGRLSRAAPEDPPVRPRPARHGRTWARPPARHVLVEAAWAAARTTGRCASSPSASAPVAAATSRQSPAHARLFLGLLDDATLGC